MKPATKIRAVTSLTVMFLIAVNMAYMVGDPVRLVQSAGTTVSSDNSTCPNGFNHTAITKTVNSTALKTKNSLPPLFDLLRDAIIAERIAVSNPVHPKSIGGAQIDMAALAELIWNRYANRILNQQRDDGQAPRVIAYECPSTGGCCGFGDRLRGMVFAFIAALLSDAAFMIRHPVPFEMSTVFDDVTFRHRALFVDPTVLNGLSDGTVYNLMNVFNPDGIKNWDLRALLKSTPVNSIRSNEFLWRKLIENAQLADRAVEYGLDRLTTFDLFRLFAHLYLRHPAPEIAAQVQAYVRKMSLEGAHVKVGVHIRTGGDVPGMDDPKLPHHAAKVFAQQVANYCADKNCAVFFASDSEIAAGIFKDEMKVLAPSVPIVKTEGRPWHLDRSGGTNADYIKSFLDWILLCRMDYLVLSRSGFGETASWVSQVPTRQVQSIDNVFDYDNIVGFKGWSSANGNFEK